MGDCDDLNVDRSAAQSCFSGLEPDVIIEIKNLTVKHVDVCHALLDVDCLCWANMAYLNPDGGAVGLTTAFNESMIIELNESLFMGHRKELARTLPFLFRIAKERSAINCAKSTGYVDGVHATKECDLNTAHNRNAITFIHFRRRGSGFVPSDKTWETHPPFSINRVVKNTKITIEDYRTRRAPPGARTAAKLAPKCESNDAETALVAEFLPINSQLRPISGLIKALGSEFTTKGRVAWRTFNAIQSRLNSYASIKRQAEHINDLIRFATQHFGGVEKLIGQISASIIRDSPNAIRIRWPTVPSAEKAAISTWADTLEVDWGLPHHLIRSATAEEGSREIIQAPPFSLEFLFKIRTISRG